MADLAFADLHAASLNSFSAAIAILLSTRFGAQF
jgi:hypothetical protein